VLFSETSLVSPKGENAVKCCIIGQTADIREKKGGCPRVFSEKTELSGSWGSKEKIRYMDVLPLVSLGARCSIMQKFNLS
jgi:hypothetical protein